ncbi:hypothetical protein B0H19DRAFT_1188575 [Mycena capillaripes]|nr:hypothetical protein B0H19DRAFT_1188575 [Mycena capillaripes]
MDSEDVDSATVSSVVTSPLDTRPPGVYRSGSECPDDRSLNELLHDFKINCEGLERQLELFSSSVRQLGSSLGLYKGSREFQRQLSSVRRLLEDESQIELLVNIIPSSQNSVPHTPLIWVHKDLWSLVDAIGTFSTAWDDFPEFEDNDRRHCLVALEQHLLVWLNILGSYEYSSELLRCVRELLFDTILELGRVNGRLADFIATGVHEIGFAQKHSTQILLNSATIATFFSAVTVTTIQYSFNNVTTPLQIAVNTLWFSSLVLSVSSAINSLLAMTWRQAIYSTPQRRVPWWVRMWFKQTPIILLSLSVLSFLAGLLCFVFLTQNQFTQFIVSTITAIVALGLGAISVWFAWERWDFSRLRRELWLSKEDDKLESSWGMLVYHFIVGIIWRSTSTPLPTRSPSRRPPRISGIEGIFQWSLADGSTTRPGEDALKSNIATTVFTYSDHVFSEFSVQRTLKLGQSENVIRHIQFSPKGTWFAACTKSICYIYRVKPQMSMHQTLKHPVGQIRQFEWSPNEQHLLIRVSGGIELWEINHNLENRHKVWIGKIIKRVQWVATTVFLVLTEDGLIKFKIHDDGHLSQDRTVPFEMGLYTFAVVPPGNCVLVIAGHRSRVHEEIRFPKRTVRSIMNYHLGTGNLLQSFPLLRDARWITVSADGVHVLLGFGTHQAPELWSFGHHGDNNGLSFKHRFTSNLGKDRFSGPPHFVGARDEFVACATSVNSIQIWKRDENRIVNTLTMSPNHHRPGAATIPIMAWHPGQAMFASAGSEIEVWVPDIISNLKENESSGNPS